jgi:hypothetical protein
MFIFALGAFAGSLLTSWANLLFLKEEVREEKQEQKIISRVDKYL